MLNTDDDPDHGSQTGQAPANDRRPDGTSDPGMWAVAGFGLVAVLCCVGSALLAGTALAGVGAYLRSPIVVIVGAIVVVATLRFALYRRRVKAQCCDNPPVGGTPR